VVGVFFGTIICCIFGNNKNNLLLDLSFKGIQNNKNIENLNLIIN
jgi:hypothetical protein